jgi:hypothetical protein
MAETYFHIAYGHLGEGSIIQPGNWGRIIRRYPVQQSTQPLMARELIFELVRVNEFSNKPSRLAAAFVFEKQEDALTFLHKERKYDVLHEVEFVNPTAPSHRADSILKWPDGNLPFISSIEELARSYWSGNNISVPEIITSSPLRVLGTIST